MLHIKFCRNRPTDSREDLLRVFTIYGHSGHLGHVTSIMSSDFISLYLKAFIHNLVQNSTVVPEKIRFEFLYVHGIWPVTFNTHIPSLIQL